MDYNKILNLAKDILRVTALEMPQYKEFLLVQGKNLDLWEVEHTWVWMYINFNKPKFVDQNIPDWYLSSTTLPSKTIKFDSTSVDFDFIVSWHGGYVDLIEIVSPGIWDSWDGKFESYKFIDN